MDITFSNLLRILAIISVLIIHATYAAQVEFSKSLNLLSSDFIFVLLNQLARFSVPIFVILSGYGLTSKYKKQKEIDLREFYLNRFFKIGIPFLFWTIILLLIQVQFKIDLEFFKKLIYYLTVTGVDYHFYFFIIIIQCYILFPVLFKFNNKYLLIVLLMLQLFNYSPTDKIFYILGLNYYVLPSTFVLSWLFYFYFGIFISKNERFFADIVNKYNLLLYIILLISFIIIILEYLLYSYKHLPFYYFDHFHRYSVFGYSITFLLIYYKLSQNFNIKFTNIISNIASITFAVYIFHTQILRLLDIYFYHMIFIKTLLLIIISFSIFYLINILFQNKKVQRFEKIITIIKLIIGL